MGMKWRLDPYLEGNVQHGRLEFLSGVPLGSQRGPRGKMESDLRARGRRKQPPLYISGWGHKSPQIILEKGLILSIQSKMEPQINLFGYLGKK